LRARCWAAFDLSGPLSGAGSKAVSSIVSTF
jgi:hypothetical protein